MKNLLIALCLCVPLPLSLTAQSPAFEVASVKPADMTLHGGGYSHVDAESIDFGRVTLFEFIRRAYAVRPHQLIGPAWINTARYTISARAAGRAPKDKILLMTQTLLAERFGLVIHREARPMLIYALVVTGKGPKLQEATGRGPNNVVSSPDGRETVYEHESMEYLVIRLSLFLDRPVIDETGLKGLYNFRLAAENHSRLAAHGSVSGAADITDTDAPPSVFTDIPARLGLKLQAKKEPIDVLVIDHIEKPSGN